MGYHLQMVTWSLSAISNNDNDINNKTKTTIAKKEHVLLLSTFVIFSLFWQLCPFTYRQVQTCQPLKSFRYNSFSLFQVQFLKFLLHSDGNTGGPGVCRSAQEVRQWTIQFFHHWGVSKPVLWWVGQFCSRHS